jgi:membrane fusion protein
VSYATRKLAGEVVLATPIQSRLLGYGLILIVFGLGLFAATATYARKETVAGWLTPQAGLIRLTARQGGVVTAIHVEEGQAVRAGQGLVSLGLSPALASGDSYLALSRSLQAQDQAAKAQGQARLATLDAEYRQLLDRRAALIREHAQVSHRLELQNARVELAKTELSRAQTLAEKGFLSRQQLDRQQSEVLALEQDGANLAIQILSYERQISDVDARLLAIPLDRTTAKATTTSARASLDQQATQTQGQSTYLVAASQAGQIAALPLSPGQTVAPGGVVAVLTPGNSPLEAELYVPSRAAGFVREGQEVQLMYQAYPHQKFGTGRGVVTSVSRTVLAPPEVAIPGLQLQEPVFRVRVRLAKTTIMAYGQNLPLQPGLVLSADVIIDRRSLIEWLLDPLYAVGRRS